ncbi:MAG: aldo/keto reductase family protein [Hyphomonadaceae bacterium]
MQYRKLGASDLMVSEISLGSWLTYGVGVEADKTRACVKRALDLGINLIDTANVYGRGAAETVLGETLAGVKRESYVLATKLYWPMDAHNRGLSRQQVFKQIDDSLKRLRTDYVDLYQCHRYDDETPLEETMQALSEIVQQGKVRWLGFSEWPADKIEAAFALPNVARFVSSQPQYSLLWRQPEKEVIPVCKKHDVSQIVWSPLAQGVLSGKYKPGAELPKGSRATSRDMSDAIQGWMRPGILRAVEKLEPLAKRAGCSMAQFALAWVLREPNVASAIVGASRPEQVEENAKASGLNIDPALFTEAETICTPPAR